MNVPQTRMNTDIAKDRRHKSTVFSIGRSVIIGLGKNQSYQWFRGNRQAVFLHNILLQTRRQQETMNGVSF